MAIYAAFICFGLSFTAIADQMNHKRFFKRLAKQAF
jgi:hypothetical protein